MRWRLVWTAFLLAFVVGFAVLEGHALSTGGMTLSRFVWELSEAWPPLPFVIGNVTGGLAVHFWWHWDPRIPDKKEKRT